MRPKLHRASETDDITAWLCFIGPKVYLKVMARDELYNVASEVQTESARLKKNGIWNSARLLLKNEKAHLFLI